MSEHFDVLVVGAGLSGVGAGYWLQKHCPQKSYAILEGRARMGGTWDLFRYPGIRSDSDMFTLGYSFKPWTDPKAIADGPSILRYINDTAREYGIDQRIRYGQRVASASFSSADARWTVQVDKGAERVVYTCDFLYMCSGYYRYESGYTPDFAGMGDFRGALVHPQAWPENLDYSGKRVIVIGSGATAMTLVPEMAKKAAHVTMVQRSPTYVVARPSRDAVADFLRAKLPAKLAYSLVRWKNVGFGMYFYNLCKRNPQKVKDYLLGLVRQQLPAGYDVGRDFTPRYNPWDQRLCLITDGDLFTAIKEGRASIATDTIDRFTENGLKLTGGQEIEADVVVVATGLFLQQFGGAQLTVDGRKVELSKTLNYKGMMFSDVPNLAATFGYTNASWTLKADLIGEYVCRILNTMDAKGKKIAVAHNDDPNLPVENFVDFSSGYFQRAVDTLPKQGAKKPWRLHQNYAKDMLALRFGAIEDGVLRFADPSPQSTRAPDTEKAAA
ncbi:MAG: NAD(P)/FAD-dependent oxidoreductase [Hyphomicrobiales bacterium]|nr:NAD(P)/FAD-dependent oxidoreductase [Hyphomicrobiales bacterium]